MVTWTDDVLTSPAPPLILQLQATGVHFKLARDRVFVWPKGILTRSNAPCSGHSSRRFVAVVAVTTDEGVEAQRDFFTRLIDGASADVVLPALVFRADVPYVPGMCFSCGDRLPQPRFGRCWRCSVAWRLVCRFPIPADLATAIDGTRKVG